MQSSFQTWSTADAPAAGIVQKKGTEMKKRKKKMRVENGYTSGHVSGAGEFVEDGVLSGAFLRDAHHGSNAQGIKRVDLMWGISWKQPPGGTDAPDPTCGQGLASDGSSVRDLEEAEVVGKAGHLWMSPVIGLRQRRRFEKGEVEGYWRRHRVW
ncbi:hypothetical protein P280DRAFT_503380 [Massarina eburnea CBS 473.64]|uniref:Uncharacterized protein n=1 Tax=Massarina eburnea CBS 473.64 TaxID=1395130 RepID=A0A6A6SIW4_9PLEO|nr:hypothetical protein P280DRAFT_503380 [Massarina eburnea CBS 473.64]